MLWFSILMHRYMGWIPISGNGLPLKDAPSIKVTEDRI